MTKISGHTRLIAHIGVPTESFKAPMIYNPWFEHQGIDTVVVPMGCEAEHYRRFLPTLFSLRNIAGALVTMPHKVISVELLDHASTTVQICGACNAIKRDDDGKLVGDMFDGQGFVRSALGKGLQLRGNSALLLGCGGVGSAIAASLAAEGVARIGLFDPDTRAQHALAAKLAAHYPHIAIHQDDNDPAGWGIVVNATPLGMRADDPLPVDVQRLEATTFVGEVVMSQALTPFLSAARARGCQTQMGTDMLFEQIPATLAFFGYPNSSAAQLQRLAQLAD